MSHDQPTSTPSAAVQSLREQIGRENMTQSSVLATRRLDDALLRLDRAAGRKRDQMVCEEEHQGPKPTARSGLELDHSVAQNTSLWLEDDEDTGRQIRIDSEHSQPGPRAPHFQSTPPPQPSTPNGPSTPNAGGEQRQAEPVEEAPPQAEAAFSDETFEAFFTEPIDVMILATTAKIANRAEQEMTAPQTAQRQTRRREGSEDLETPLVSTPQSEPLAPPIAATTPAAQQIETVQTAPEPIEPEPIEPEQTETGQTEPAAPIALQNFTAAWQVNEFVVPSTIDELFLAGSIAEQLSSRLAAAREQGLRTIAITSTQAGEGRSTVAIGMALSVAFSGLRVALVDADREGVKIATDLHLDLDHGWPDALRSQLPLEEVAVSSIADAVTLLPLLERSSEKEAAFTTQELRQCLMELRKSFDMVIVDCAAAALDEVTLCDTSLIVRDLQRTKAAAVETLAMSLRRNGSHGVGVIENFC